MKFYFSGGGYLGGGEPLWGAPPIIEALDLYLAMLGDADIPWAVAVLGGSLLDTPIARAALERGGHLRVGIEDWDDGPDERRAGRRRGRAVSQRGSHRGRRRRHGARARPPRLRPPSSAAVRSGSSRISVGEIPLRPMNFFTSARIDRLALVGVVEPVVEVGAGAEAELGDAVDARAARRVRGAHDVLRVVGQPDVVRGASGACTSVQCRTNCPCESPSARRTNDTYLHAGRVLAVGPGAVPRRSTRCGIDPEHVHLPGDRVAARDGTGRSSRSCARSRPSSISASHGGPANGP